MSDRKKKSDPDAASGTSENVSEETQATAYHEAGHAVMAVMLGRPIEKVTIVPAQLQAGGGRLGLCKIQKGRTKPSKDELEDDILILLAGMVSESHVTGRYCESGAGQDLRMVESLLANRARNERQLEKLVKRALDKTEYMLADDVAVKAIQLVANELLERETISGRTVRHMVRMAEQQFS